MHRAARSERPRASRRPPGLPTHWPAVAGGLLVVALVAGVGLTAVGDGAKGPALPELTRTTQRTVSIPFRLPAPQDPDADAAAQRVVLQVSKDLGGSWTPAGEAAASATSFSYTADADGEYWFRLRAVDRRGRMRGGEGPDMRVLVDAAGPRLAARVWKGADGEIACRYSAADDSIDLKSLKVEYRVGGGEWKTVATEGILARQSPAHVVGEDIWWAGEKVESLTVRIAVADEAGNRTNRQFTMEAADPGVDQAALAAEVGVPPLPAPDAQAGLPPSVVRSAPVATQPGTQLGTQPGTWKAETATWSGGDAPAGDATGVVVRRIATEATPGDAARIPAAAGDASRLLGRSVPTPTADGRMEYRGRPLQLSRSRRFTWDYELPAEAADGRQLRAELWSTRDGGVTWQRAAVDADGVSPINVEVPAPGLYGFRLEMVATDATTGGPRSGDAPETWVGIDEDPPHVELQGVSRDDDADALVIRWSSRDPLLPPKSARILYSPHAEGPWATILAEADNQGEHRWSPDRSVPAKVFVRIEVTDAAGNMGFAASPEAVSISQSRFVGRLGGLRPQPAPAP